MRHSAEPRTGGDSSLTGAVRSVAAPFLVAHSRLPGFEWTPCDTTPSVNFVSKKRTLPPVSSAPSKVTVPPVNFAPVKSPPSNVAFVKSRSRPRQVVGALG